MKRLFILTVLVLFPLIHASPAQAATIQENWIIDKNEVSPESIQAWSELSGTRDFLFRLGNATPWELQSIDALEGYANLRILLDRYPSSDLLTNLSSLALKGTELVVMTRSLPTPYEIGILNESGLTKLTLVVPVLPTLYEAQNLSSLQTQVSLTLATGFYPRYEDQPLYEAMPTTLPLQFIASYWPFYAHMDALNLLQQPRRLRVDGAFPPEETWSYLHGIRDLTDVDVVYDHDATGMPWEKFESLNVRWISVRWVPSSAALDKFCDGNGARTILLDLQRELNSNEKQALESSYCTVEWLRSPVKW